MPKSPRLLVSFVLPCLPLNLPICAIFVLDPQRHSCMFVLSLAVLLWFSFFRERVCFLPSFLPDSCGGGGISCLPPPPPWLMLPLSRSFLLPPPISACFSRSLSVMLFISRQLDKTPTLVRKKKKKRKRKGSSRFFPSTPQQQQQHRRFVSTRLRHLRLSPDGTTLVVKSDEGGVDHELALDELLEVRSKREVFRSLVGRT